MLLRALLLLSIVWLFSILTGACQPPDQKHLKSGLYKAKVTPGIYQMDRLVSYLGDKRVGLIVNHTSMIDNIHLVDTLLAREVRLGVIFSPEHGFKGTAYNGEEVLDGEYLGKYPIRSLYGKTRKPTTGDMNKIDVLVFDIQDVGVRFYTYASTLHYVMESAAEHNKEVIILDRPNPNAHFIDGPIRKEQFKSFIGMHPVPIVYGMTIGEYGQMINGEGWLKNGIQCRLEVIPIGNYTHSTEYILPVAPSPNLPNQRSVLLYPSICLFEGTVISEGRGTNRQFQVYGHPVFDKEHFSFVPESMSSSKYPKHEGLKCGGVDLTNLDTDEILSWKKINLSYLQDAYQKFGVNGRNDPAEDFFLKNGFFEKLAGTEELRMSIIDGKSEEEIRSGWEDDLSEFRKIREKYLIYPE